MLLIISSIILFFSFILFAYSTVFRFNVLRFFLVAGPIIDNEWFRNWCRVTVNTVENKDDNYYSKTYTIFMTDRPNLSYQLAIRIFR